MLLWHLGWLALALAFLPKALAQTQQIDGLALCEIYNQQVPSIQKLLRENTTDYYRNIITSGWDCVGKRPLDSPCGTSRFKAWTGVRCETVGGVTRVVEPFTERWWSYPLNINIPCAFVNSTAQVRRWVYDSRYFCYPACLTEAARTATTSCRSWYCPSPCPNARCSLSEYYDEESASCTACPTGSVSLDFSVSASDCLNIAGNMNVAYTAIFVAIAVILVYVYFGRIHWVAFIRMERLVLVLIKMYSVTIKALIGLRSQLRKSERSSVAAQPNATAEDRAHAESEQANHRKNVYIFWMLVVVILLTAPAVLYILQMWSTFLNTLLLWNGWKDPIAGYAQTITSAIASIADNEFSEIYLSQGADCSSLCPRSS